MGKSLAFFNILLHKEPKLFVPIYANVAMIITRK